MAATAAGAARHAATVSSAADQDQKSGRRRLWCVWGSDENEEREWLAGAERTADAWRVSRAPGAASGGGSIPKVQTLIVALLSVPPHSPRPPRPCRCG